MHEKHSFIQPTSPQFCIYTQGEFQFEQNATAAHLLKHDGVASWREEQAAAMRALSRKLGLPIGHKVEVCLKDGVIVTGRLTAGEVVLDLENLDKGKLALQVGDLVFFYHELESCVRLD